MSNQIFSPFTTNSSTDTTNSSAHLSPQQLHQRNLAQLQNNQAQIQRFVTNNPQGSLSQQMQASNLSTSSQQLTPNQRLSTQGNLQRVVTNTPQTLSSSVPSQRTQQSNIIQELFSSLRQKQITKEQFSQKLQAMGIDLAALKSGALRSQSPSVSSSTYQPGYLSTSSSYTTNNTSLNTSLNTTSSSYASNNSSLNSSLPNQSTQLLRNNASYPQGQLYSQRYTTPGMLSSSNLTSNNVSSPIASFTATPGRPVSLTPMTSHSTINLVSPTPSQPSSQAPAARAASSTETQDFRKGFDVIKAAGINVGDESASLTKYPVKGRLANSMTSQVNNRPFLDLQKLSDRMTYLCAKEKLKLADDVPKFMSLAVTDLFRDIAEALIKTAHQRQDKRKKEFEIEIIRDPRNQLKLIQQREKDEKQLRPPSSAYPSATNPNAANTGPTTQHIPPAHGAVNLLGSYSSGPTSTGGPTAGGAANMLGSYTSGPSSSTGPSSTSTLYPNSQQPPYYLGSGSSSGSPFPFSSSPSIYQSQVPSVYSQQQQQMVSPYSSSPASASAPLYLSSSSSSTTSAPTSVSSSSLYNSSPASTSLYNSSNPSSTTSSLYNSNPSTSYLYNSTSSAYNTNTYNTTYNSAYNTATNTSTTTTTTPTNSASGLNTNSGSNATTMSGSNTSLISGTSSSTGSMIGATNAATTGSTGSYSSGSTTAPVHGGSLSNSYLPASTTSNTTNNTTSTTSGSAPNTTTTTTTGSYSTTPSSYQTTATTMPTQSASLQLSSPGTYTTTIPTTPSATGSYTTTSSYTTTPTTAPMMTPTTAGGAYQTMQVQQSNTTGTTGKMSPSAMMPKFTRMHLQRLQILQMKKKSGQELTQQDARELKHLETVIKRILVLRKDNHRRRFSAVSLLDLSFFLHSHSQFKHYKSVYTTLPRLIRKKASMQQ